MKFAVPLILVAALGAAAWIALRPVEVTVPPTTPRADRAPKPTPLASAETPTTGSGTSGARPPVDLRPPGARKAPRPRVTGALRPGKAGDTTLYEKPTTARARAPSATPAEGLPSRKWGRSSAGQKMAKYPASAVKDGFRRYYANLPKSGRMPSRIELEEVMPADLISRLNLPSSARVTEIGSWSASSPEGFKEVLAIDPKTQSTLGFSVEVDGERYREYIELTE